MEEFNPYRSVEFFFKNIIKDEIGYRIWHYILIIIQSIIGIGCLITRHPIMALIVFVMVLSMISSAKLSSKRIQIAQNELRKLEPKIAEFKAAREKIAND